MPELSRYTLKSSEMAWWLIDNDEGNPLMNKEMIGNDWDVELLRDGSEVLITSETIGFPKSRIIPSDTTIKGFDPLRDGLTLYLLTDNDVIYNHALHLIT